MPVARKKAIFLFVLLAAGASSCESDQSRQPARHPAAPRPAASVQLPALGGNADTTPSSSPPLANQLRPIRANYRRIEGITEWSATAVRSLDEPGECGEATFYYAHGQLEKVVARHFGEMSQRRVTYYLLHGQPSFVLEQAYAYNRPMYYDSAAMRQAHDNEIFDFDKSVVEESRSYFDHGRLVQQLSNQDGGAPFAADYLRNEQNRLVADYKAVMRSR